MAALQALDVASSWGLPPLTPPSTPPSLNTQPSSLLLGSEDIGKSFDDDSVEDEYGYGAMDDDGYSETNEEIEENLKMVKHSVEENDNLFGRWSGRNDNVKVWGEVVSKMELPPRPNEMYSIVDGYALAKSGKRVYESKSRFLKTLKEREKRDRRKLLSMMRKKRRLNVVDAVSAVVDDGEENQHKDIDSVTLKEEDVIMKETNVDHGAKSEEEEILDDDGQEEEGVELWGLDMDDDVDDTDYLIDFVKSSNWKGNDPLDPPILNPGERLISRMRLGVERIQIGDLVRLSGTPKSRSSGNLT